MSISSLLECAQKMAELITEINQLAEKIPHGHNFEHQQLATLQQKLTSMKIYVSEILDGLGWWHKMASRLKHDLWLFLWISVGSSIGILGTLHFCLMR